MAARLGGAQLEIALRFCHIKRGASELKSFAQVINDKIVKSKRRLIKNRLNEQEKIVHHILIAQKENELAADEDSDGDGKRHGRFILGRRNIDWLQWLYSQYTWLYLQTVHL